jgi:hypothetical protein
MSILNEIKDKAAQEYSYQDYAEMICVEDGPANPGDIEETTEIIARRFADHQVIEFQTEGWTLSRERMPDVDGQYHIYGFMHHECGNVTPFQKIVQCQFNQWIKIPGEQMTYWRPLLLPPNIKSNEL